MRFFVTLIATALLAPAAAHADGPSTLVQDCQDGRINGTYSAKQYRDALRDLPTDVDEYTDCRGTLRAAQLRSAAPRSAPAAAGAGGGPGAAAGAVPQVAGSVAQPGDPPAPAGGAPAATPTVGAAPAGARAPGTSSGRPRASKAPRAAVDAVTAAAAGGTPTVDAAQPVAPVVAVTGAGADVPAGLALVLTVLGAAALGGAALVRRHRRA